ncbi:alpha/beta fold hydrolase [Streptomyces sp. H27-S2]|uniref:alpha/beta fold hydrolase n=1 Tax=Streptomyces antarcticus TaxID=2996458 RepID=UPI0022707F7D|nr:alpha/beta hydrolase [Streptomyces sp. H27-S2]MCY0953728.1 alpha/beta hydrolase [Streptomyces sp. H27-S2]
MRHDLTIDDRTLSYLDFGGPGRPLLALHGGLSEGAHFAGLAAALGDDWRVIAPDQRGHGDSDRADAYDRAGYVADAIALLEHLGLTAAPVAVLGFSLGGLNAYRLAADRPDLVSALVNVDAPVEIPSPLGHGFLGFLPDLPYTAATREELVTACGPLGEGVAPFLRPLPDGSGWRLPFHPQDTLATVEQGYGSHWDTWLASDCPALLVHGLRSTALPQAQADAMVARRPGTAYVGLDTEHYVPFQDPEGFTKAVRTFLAGL